MTEKEALSRLQKICSRQEKCVNDVRLKLSDWNMNDSQSDNIVKNLISGRFIDEARYAQSFANDKFRFNKWGKTKIVYALRQKRVDDEIIKKAIDQIDEEAYRECITDILKKKRKTLKEKDAAIIRLKLTRFALSKGFDYGMADRVVQSVIKED